jgi:predicted site-specific integrase-resolvase
MVTAEAGNEAALKRTYSTQKAASKIGVSFRTLNRWLALRKIRPSQAIAMEGGRTLWRWTDADIAKGRKVKAAQKPGPKAGIK